MIFLDHNATTKIAPEALEAMIEAYKFPLNNSSTHNFGRRAKKIVETAREELKKLLNAQNYEVIFTGSATEATNTVMFGVDVKRILYSGIEHASVYGCRPEDKEIIEINATQDGIIDLADLEKKLPDDGSFLTSAMYANNETGAIQPIEEISKLTHQKGGLFHCDLVQVVGKIPLDLEKINADFVSVSAHKINGPQGVGALLVRKGLDVTPLIYGGKQEKSKRAGTTNTAGIAGFGAACKIATDKIAKYEEVRKLRDELEVKIKEIAGDDVMIISENVTRTPNTSYIALRGCDAQSQTINFDLNRICVSGGSACSSGTTSESRILKTMGISPEFIRGAIRVSLAPDNTPDEIQTFIEVWSEFYERNKA